MVCIQGKIVPARGPARFGWFALLCPPLPLLFLFSCRFGIFGTDPGMLAVAAGWDPIFEYEGQT